ncbi:hypothetical protein [Mycolicibacterium sp. J2]|uniref:hypothetical protein n=1 Tax=Mycolicibacterium sp. J2 TaxID=2993511 RepID=UPI00224A61D4|nr:hypothetical protein [Mycolicibacterium sp. J2]MCX2711973.1 hypothetical protein [Mycolicibacterium sp. J2]
MTYGYQPFPAPPPVPRPRSGIDLGVSVTLLVLTYAGGAAAAVLGVFMMAFTDYCPPATCDIDTGVMRAMTGFGVAALVALAGTVATIVALVRRARGWPWALGTMVVCGVACGLALAGYVTAVGG